MEDEALHQWALANRAALTLDLLSTIAQVQSQAQAGDREQLWALGSKLMAVREGLGALFCWLAGSPWKISGMQGEGSVPSC